MQKSRMWKIFQLNIFCLLLFSGLIFAQKSHAITLCELFGIGCSPSSPLYTPPSNPTPSPSPAPSPCDCAYQRCGGCFPFGGGDPCATWAAGSSCDGSCCVYPSGGGGCNSSCDSWSACSVTCGGGTQTQSCTASDCSWYDNTQSCNTQPCVPLSVEGSCNSSGRISLNWTGGPASNYYNLRIDETSNNGQSGMIDGWYRSDPPDLILNWYPGKSYSYQGIPGKNYGVWVHPTSDLSLTASTSVSCPALSCGTRPANTVACPGTDIGLTSANSWHSIGQNLAACDSTKKCEYADVCVPNNSGCAANTCIGASCHDGCSWISGIKNCTPTLNLTVSPNPVDYNVASMLTWTTTNSASCLASGDWTGWKTSTGGSESTGNLTSARTYNLECWNSSNISSGIKSVTVNIKTYSCTNPPASWTNKTKCHNTEVGLTIDTLWKKVAVCSGKCEYTECIPQCNCTSNTCVGSCGAAIPNQAFDSCGVLDCSSTVCAESPCPPCNSGNWREMSP